MTERGQAQGDDGIGGEATCDPNTFSLKRMRGSDSEHMDDDDRDTLSESIHYTAGTVLSALRTHPSQPLRDISTIRPSPLFYGWGNRAQRDEETCPRSHFRGNWDPVQAVWLRVQTLTIPRSCFPGRQVRPASEGEERTETDAGGNRRRGLQKEAAKRVGVRSQREGSSPVPSPKASSGFELTGTICT